MCALTELVAALKFHESVMIFIFLDPGSDFEPDISTFTLDLPLTLNLL